MRTTLKNAELLIINSSQLLTLAGPKRPRNNKFAGELGVIENGAVAIRNGIILETGSTSEMLKKYGQKKPKILDAAGKLVMPGFVDCHTHVLFAGSREHELELRLQGKSYLDLIQAGGGILSTVRAVRAASQEELVAQTLPRLRTMLSFGTTTAEVKSGYGLNRQTELKMLNAIEMLLRAQPLTLVPTFLGAHALPPEFKRNEEYIEYLNTVVLPVVAKKKLAIFCDIFCDEGAFNINAARTHLMAAKKLGLKLKIHADELKATGGARLAAELGAQTADHLLHTSEPDLNDMAERSVIAVVLPLAPYALMSTKLPNARKMLSLGIPIALGTDLSPNCWCESMQLVISSACYKLGLTPAEALVSATINAAYAIGTGERIGSLEPGKEADIIILNCDNYRHIPYHFGVNLVSEVIKKGYVFSFHRKIG